MIFGFFSKKNKRASRQKRPDSSVSTLEFDDTDYLLFAAQAADKAKSAVKEKKYDKAWRQFHVEKSNYLKHGERCGFSPSEVLALDATVHEKMANVRRLEGKHVQALTDIVYWISAGRDRPLKRHDSKFNTYYNRCKFQNTDAATALREVKGVRGLAEYTVAQSIVNRWAKNG